MLFQFLCVQMLDHSWDMCTARYRVMWDSGKPASLMAGGTRSAPREEDRECVVVLESDFESHWRRVSIVDIETGRAIKKFTIGPEVQEETSIAANPRQQLIYIADAANLAIAVYDMNGFSFTFLLFILLHFAIY